MTAAELPADHTDVPDELDIVSGFANHEAKSLLMLHLANSGEELTRHEMGSSFKEFIGYGAAWYPNPAVPYTYCEGSLESTGQVERIIQWTGGIRAEDAFRISKPGKRIGVPAAGLILDWSLQYPDISVQQVLGSRRSAGSFRAPQSRVAILSRLVEQPTAGLSMSELAGLDPRLDPLSKEYINPLARTGSSVEVLEALGIVNVERLADQNPRGYHIVDLDPAPRFGPNRKPTGMALHKFIENRYRSDDPRFSFDECVSHVIGQLKRKKEATEPAAVRKQIQLMLANSRRVGDGRAYYYWPGVERGDLFNEGTNTKVTLNDTYRLAIQHLIEVVAGVTERDPVTLKYGRRLAGEITVDPDQKIKLIDKAYAFSNHARRQSSVQSIAALRRILAGRGPTDVQTIRDELVSLDSRPRSVEAVRDLLHKAEGQGAVTLVPAPTNTSRRTKRHHYELTAA